MAKALVGDAAKIELMTTTVDGRFPTVLSGKADFGISTATIYPDRAVRLAFTRPYIDSSTLVVVPKGSPIKTLADFDRADVTLGSTNSAAMVDRAKRYAPKATPSSSTPTAPPRSRSRAAAPAPGRRIRRPPTSSSAKTAPISSCSTARSARSTTTPSS